MDKIIDNKMKLFAFTALSMLFLASSAQAYVSLTFLTSTSPATVQPGTQATILLAISNTGTEFAATPQLIVKGTQYIVPNTAIFNLPAINAGGSTQVSIPVTISPNAPEGTAILPFTLSYTVGNSVGTVSVDNSASFTITKRTLLQVIDVSYSKSVIQRGDMITMTITLQNVGSGQVKDLDVSLRNFTLPVVPANTDTEKYIGMLNPGQATNVSFDLAVSNTADTVTYSIPVTLLYYDDQGNIHSDMKFAGLRITGVPDFVVALDSTTGILAGQSNKMSVTISNVGTGTAQFVTVNIDGNQDVSPQTSYIGTLNPDDSSSISLDVNLAGKPAGKQALNITLLFKDSYNQPYVETKIVNFDAVSAPVQIPTNYGIVIIVVIAILAYWKRNYIKSKLKRK